MNDRGSLGRSMEREGERILEWISEIVLLIFCKVVLTAQTCVNIYEKLNDVKLMSLTPEPHSPTSLSLHIHIVQPNIQTHRSLFSVLVDILEFLNIPNMSG